MNIKVAAFTVSEKWSNIDSNRKSYHVNLHDFMAIWYTALYQITAIFWQNKKFGFVGWASGISAIRRSKG